MTKSLCVGILWAAALTVTSAFAHEAAATHWLTFGIFLGIYAILEETA